MKSDIAKLSFQLLGLLCALLLWVVVVPYYVFKIIYDALFIVADTAGKIKWK